MYLALKLLHIVAVILFLGNITTGLFWHAHAARTKQPIGPAPKIASMITTPPSFARCSSAVKTLAIRLRSRGLLRS